MSIVLQTVVLVSIALCTVLMSTTASVITEQRARMARSQSRIVDGVNVTPVNKYPMLVSLVDENNGSTCAGTILNKYHVLTFAGCCRTMIRVGFDKYKIHAGIYHFGAADPRYIQRLPIESATYHEFAYNFSKGGFMDNFIGIVKTSREFVWNDYVAPTNLPPPEWDVMPYQEFTVSTVGWGVGKDGNYVHWPTRPLQEITLPLSSTENCQQQMPGTRITNQQMCVKGRNGAGPCWGDFGAPLFLYDEASGKHLQIGVTTEFNLACDDATRPDFAIYAKVSKYLTWIANNMRMCDPTRRISK